MRSDRSFLYLSPKPLGEAEFWPDKMISVMRSICGQICLAMLEVLPSLTSYCYFKCYYLRKKFSSETTGQNLMNNYMIDLKVWALGIFIQEKQLLYKNRMLLIKPGEQLRIYRAFTFVNKFCMKFAFCSSSTKISSGRKLCFAMHYSQNACFENSVLIFSLRIH